jgi:hypothetical protein
MSSPNSWVSLSKPCTITTDWGCQEQADPSGISAIFRPRSETSRATIALKFLGLPLKQIKVVLNQVALALPDAMRNNASVFLASGWLFTFAHACLGHS